jgi:hypothetical protein
MTHHTDGAALVLGGSKPKTQPTRATFGLDARPLCLTCPMQRRLPPGVSSTLVVRTYVAAPRKQYFFSALSINSRTCIYFNQKKRVIN